MRSFAWQVSILTAIVTLSGCDTNSSAASTSDSPVRTVNDAPVQELAAPAASPAAAPAGPVAEGAVAPPFTLPGSDGKDHSLADYAGQYVVLSFFPKAFTGG